MTILATCVSFELNPRAYLHEVTKLILNGWPKARLRELHPELAVVRAQKPISALRWPGNGLGDGDVAFERVTIHRIHKEAAYVPEIAVCKPFTCIVFDL